MTAWLPLLTLLVGLAVLAVAVVVVVRTDRSWHPQLRTCRGCSHRWLGRGTRCPRCSGPSEADPAMGRGVA